MNDEYALTELPSADGRPETADGMRDHRLCMLWSLLRQTYTLVEKNQDRSLADYGLNMSKYMALFIVNYSTKPVNPTAIATYLSQETPSITYALDRLEERGWIERQPAPDDRREIVLKITPTGRELLEKANALTWSPIVQISEVIDGVGELDAVFNFLVKLRDRAAELCGANIESLDSALRHRRRDPFMYGPRLAEND
jgi:DNA-binding MarR family transcriptional regulator